MSKHIYQQKNKKKAIIILSILMVCLAFIIIMLELFKPSILNLVYKNYTVPIPTTSSNWANHNFPELDGDIYVSPIGSDSNIGDKNSPIKTIEYAMQKVANLNKTNKDKIVVCIEAGVYNINSLKFMAEHGGTENCNVIYSSYGGEVVFNSGIELHTNDFVSVDNYPNLANSLSQDIKNKIHVLDLKKEPYNLTKNDWGKLYPIGTYNTANRYLGDTTGPMYSELFINGIRQNLARYPNDGYIKTDTVISVGKDSENKSNGEPAGDTYKINDNLASKVQKWHNIDNVWMYGFLQYDWADGSTPIEKFDAETNFLTTKYQSFFGTKENSPYFFYNCLEELDIEGEWYLDRENGLLCIYEPANFENASIYISISTDTIVSINSNYLTLRNITITGTRGNGIEIIGNNNLVEGCKITNIGGHAINVIGLNNKITQNEVSYVGKSGISIVGGDKTTLTPGNNLVDNNIIHDWSQIFKTYQAGINFGGVGNICSHNELYNSPHLGITYDGNNHLFEYNLIHDICLESDDAGAIYAGGTWSSYGNDIRFNLIYNLGGNEFSPNGIYMDDAISGQNIYGNILINIPKHAIFLGGGRDLNVYDNLIINAGNGAIRYDARARYGIQETMWFSDFVDKETGALWTTLHSSPWKTEIWQNAFPQYKNITDNFDNLNDSNFMANPANSNIENNIIFDKTNSEGNIDNVVYEFSKIKNNKTYYLFQLKKSFKGYKKGNYKVNNKSEIYSYIENQINEVIEKVGRY